MSNIVYLSQNQRNYIKPSRISVSYQTLEGVERQNTKVNNLRGIYVLWNEGRESQLLSNNMLE